MTTPPRFPVNPDVGGPDFYAPLPIGSQGKPLWSLTMMDGVMPLVWRAVTFQNTWGNLGGVFAPCQFAADGRGLVQLRGLATRGTGLPVAGENICSVPNGYLAQALELFTVIQGSYNAIGSSTSRVDCDNIGNVVWTGQGPNGAPAETDFTSLAQVSWRAIPNSGAGQNAYFSGWHVTDQWNAFDELLNSRTIYNPDLMPLALGYTRQYMLAVQALNAGGAAQNPLILRSSLGAAALELTLPANPSGDQLATTGWVTLPATHPYNALTVPTQDFVFPSAAVNTAEGYYIRNITLYGRYI